MCGVVGFSGKEHAAPIVLGTLRNLEYRGYDSAGLATVCDGKLMLRKDAGKLDEVSQKHSFAELLGNAGIGHVRWATHGEVSAINAHPHVDCSGQVGVVHNGIIENHRELRQLLETQHDFVSNTDTEVIAHLIEEFLTNGMALEYAVLTATKRLRGSYAFLALSAKDKGKIVAARKDSPLAIGKSYNGYFIASDPISFLGQTNQVIFVEDNEIAVLDSNSLSLLDEDGRNVEKAFFSVDWKWEEGTFLAC